MPREATGSFLALRAASLMSAPGALAVALLSCWALCLSAKVTVDDQSWSCPETQLLQSPLMCPALE